jgi:hypothetical protein
MRTKGVYACHWPAARSLSLLSPRVIPAMSTNPQDDAERVAILLIEHTIRY